MMVYLYFSVAIIISPWKTRNWATSLICTTIFKLIFFILYIFNGLSVGISDFPNKDIGEVRIVNIFDIS